MSGVQEKIPAVVLSDALVDAVAGRQVTAAVFTTYTFDPGFFELHVLPLLIDYPFSQIEKVRRIQLEDMLRSVGDISVYYDFSALAPDAQPAQLDYRRIDVRRTTGVFHPKVIMLLVRPEPELIEDEDGKYEEEQPESLIVGILSANLTRGGWWENVENFHFEKIGDKDVDSRRCTFRKDLLDLIRHVRRSAPAGEDHDALDRIHRFLTRRTAREPTSNVMARGRYYTRIFVGQDDLPSWLDELRIARWQWNLEVISPFFDRKSARTLEKLIDVVNPRETRVYLPREVDGSALVTDELYANVTRAGAIWSTLPAGLLRTKAHGPAERVQPRRVHAKTYRFWDRDSGEIILAGSVNLTAPAHSAANAGNLEAAYLVDVSDERRSRRWWLTPIESEPAEFLEELEREGEGADYPRAHVSLRYHWGESALHYRIDGDYDVALVVQDLSGRTLFEINQARSNQWLHCGKEAASKIAELLPSTSFVRIVHPDGSWRVLVREEGMAHRPSLLMSLTAEEILMYWSLLSPSQQAAFIEEKLAAEVELQGIPGVRGHRYDTKNTLFDRFAGIYHAFEMLFKHSSEAIDSGHDREATARLFGAKYDSLPLLLEKTLEKVDSDPVMPYLTHLCAQQIHDRIRKRHPEFWKDHRKDARTLGKMLREIPRLRERLAIEDRDEFLEWYEEMFLKESVPE